MAVVRASRSEDLFSSIFGDGAWEISKALSAEQKRENRDKKVQQALAIGNAASVPAGIIGLGSAVATAKNPKIAGQFVSGVGRNLKKVPVGRVKQAGEKVTATGQHLTDNPSKVVNRAVGAGVIGAAVLNPTVDAGSTYYLARQEKNKVAKLLDQADVHVPGATDPVRRKLRAVNYVSETAPVMATKVVEETPKIVNGVKTTANKVRERTFRAEVPLSKRDDKKRQVFGWASVVEVDGEPVVDRQNDYVSIEEIEKAAHDYLTHSRDGGDMHKTRGTAYLIESLVVDDQKKEALGISKSQPNGWWVGFQVTSPEVWELVEKGERPMFSIHGSGKRVERYL